MFGIDSFNPVSLLATSMFGPIGGVVAQLAQQVFSSFGQNLIQQLGQNLGLPQSTIDMAQGSFAGSIGDFQGAALNLNESISGFGEATGASPSEIGSAQSGFQDIMQGFIDQMSQSEEFKQAKATGGKGGSAGANSTGAPGWLMAMAQALGAELDRLGDDMQQRAESLTGDDPSGSAEFGVVSQQFSMLMNATNNAIKSVGEAMANTARKQ
ncbi:hypothetical protein [Sphingobium aromaticiconvertens]|uniref:hypothetical protein n=1 Tax=Sphingobium aromaticiconvertens TaxID=365341 RepID=UPI00301B4598